MRFMNDVGEKIDAHSYPATTEELVEAYGEAEFDLAGGSETFGEAIERLGEQTFDSPEEVRLTAYSGISKKGIGRENYSDRDAPTVGEDGHEHVSF
jgi:hypothetical protein